MGRGSFIGRFGFMQCPGKCAHEDRDIKTSNLLYTRHGLLKLGTITPSPSEFPANPPHSRLRHLPPPYLSPHNHQPSNPRNNNPLVPLPRTTPPLHDLRPIYGSLVRRAYPRGATTQHACLTGEVGARTTLPHHRLPQLTFAVRSLWFSRVGRMEWRDLEPGNRWWSTR